MRILIADDEKGFLEFMQDRLTRYGFDVEVVSDGHEAMYRIAQAYYDMVIVDYNMPGVTGLEVIKHIKKEKIPSVTVMITGYQDIEKPLADAVGADHYFTKPVKLEELESVIINCSNQTRRDTC